jgi:hypothetical protein
MKENTHFDHKPGQRELPGYSTINDLTSTKTTPSPTNSNPLLKTGHFYFAENRTFSFCVDRDSCGLEGVEILSIKKMALL